MASAISHLKTFDQRKEGLLGFRVSEAAHILPQPLCHDWKLLSHPVLLGPTFEDIGASPWLCLR